MKLTPERIAELVAPKGVRSIAVCNFLCSLEGSDEMSAMNLHSDAASYKWNAATIKAIHTGIKEYFAR